MVIINPRDLAKEKINGKWQKIVIRLYFTTPDKLICWIFMPQPTRAAFLVLHEVPEITELCLEFGLNNWVNILTKCGEVFLKLNYLSWQDYRTVSKTEEKGVKWGRKKIVVMEKIKYYTDVHMDQNIQLSSTFILMKHCPIQYLHQCFLSMVLAQIDIKFEKSLPDFVDPFRAMRLEEEQRM